MRSILVVPTLLAAIALSAGQLRAADDAPVVPEYGVFTVPLTTQQKVANPFWDMAVSAVFTSPAGQQVKVDGFYFGGDQWQVRFVPRQIGHWTYKATLAGEPAVVKEGAFECRGEAGHGFAELSKRNRYRMEFDDGTPFYPIGAETGPVFQTTLDGTTVRGEAKVVTAEEWGKAFAGGVNLVRVQLGAGSRGNAAAPLIPAPPAGTTVPADWHVPLDRYDTELAARLDGYFEKSCQQGYAHTVILFDDMSLWGDGKTAFGNKRDLQNYKSIHADNLPMQEKYIRYIIARYGCYTDIWEMFNEDSFAPADYLARLAKVIHDADPYHHIVTSNYCRPSADWCQICTFHEYMGIPANQVDAYLTQQFAIYKAYGKPVQNTEFGNQGQLSNEDPIKWRVTVWTAFMNESGVLFWDMSFIKTRPKPGPAKGNANAYLGPETRQAFRVLNTFTHDLPIDMRPVPIGYHEQTDIRTYALSNGAVTVIYVHHYADYEKEFPAYKLMVETGPGTFRLRWINPEDGKEIKTEELSTPQEYLNFTLPPVKIDIACRVDRVEATTQAAGK